MRIKLQLYNYGFSHLHFIRFHQCHDSHFPNLYNLYLAFKTCFVICIKEYDFHLFEPLEVVAQVLVSCISCCTNMLLSGRVLFFSQLNFNSCKVRPTRSLSSVETRKTTLNMSMHMVIDYYTPSPVTSLLNTFCLYLLLQKCVGKLTYDVQLENMFSVSVQVRT